MIVNFISKNNFNNTQPINTKSNPKYRNLKPLKADTISFGCKNFVRPKDLMDLNAKEIINKCIEAMENNQSIGQGQEAIVYKIPEFAMQYCLRKEKKANINPKKLSINFNLSKFDKANFVMAKLADGLSILKFIPGIPLKIMPHRDTPSGIKVKQALQELVANEFPQKSFENAINMVEENRAQDIIFDRKGENLLVDIITKEITPIDYSPYFHDIEYNPISYIYHALDCDKSEHAPKILGKLCKAYAERLKTVDKKNLNLDVLDKNFYHRGFMEDPFNNFPDRNLLEKLRSKLFDELLEQKFSTNPDEFEWYVDCYKDFVDNSLNKKTNSFLDIDWDL